MRLPEKRQLHQILGVLADSVKKLPEIRIDASREGRTYRTKTDKEGWFSLNLPREGNYRVRIFLSRYVAVAGLSAELENISKYVPWPTGAIIEYEVIVEPNRCAFINPPLYIDFIEYEKHRGSSAAASPNNLDRFASKVD